MIEVRVAKGSSITGRLLVSMLRDKGITARVATQFAGLPDAYVCYGAGMCGNGKPVLNAQAGKLNKYSQFEKIAGAGVLTPKFFRPNVWNPQLPADVKFPLFGRKLSHKEGKDILPALQAEDVTLRMKAGIDFFTEFVPRETEYRVWIYRRRHKGTYEKVMARPEQYKYFGCSYRNGFVFNLVRSELVPQAAVEAASKAVEALGMDFGAVDVLKGKDGQFYVLEVNSAPGVEGAGRFGFQNVVESIVKWQQLGYPKRNGDNGEQNAPIARG